MHALGLLAGSGDLSGLGAKPYAMKLYVFYCTPYKNNKKRTDNITTESQRAKRECGERERERESGNKQRRQRPYRPAERTTAICTLVVMVGHTNGDDHDYHTYVLRIKTKKSSAPICARVRELS